MQRSREHFSRCRALLFPGEEDFGLTPLEANASGRPVVAFGVGGPPGVSYRRQDGSYL